MRLVEQTHEYDPEKSSGRTTTSSRSADVREKPPALIEPVVVASG